MSKVLIFILLTLFLVLCLNSVANEEKWELETTEIYFKRQKDIPNELLFSLKRGSSKEALLNISMVFSEGLKPVGDKTIKIVVNGKECNGTKEDSAENRVSWRNINVGNDIYILAKIDVTIISILNKYFIKLLIQGGTWEEEKQIKVYIVEPNMTIPVELKSLFYFYEISLRDESRNGVVKIIIEDGGEMSVNIVNGKGTVILWREMFWPFLSEKTISVTKVILIDENWDKTYIYASSKQDKVITGCATLILVVITIPLSALLYVKLTKRKHGQDKRPPLYDEFHAELG